MKHDIIFPAQCSCGHIFENYWAGDNDDGVIAFNWCGNCRKRTNLYTPHHIKLINKIRQLVIEDVPHRYQGRLLDLLENLGGKTNEQRAA